MSLRKTVFWIHLCSGIFVGVVIAIMSVTGIAIAFEEEILAWVDRDVSSVAPPSVDAQPLSPSELKTAIDREMPEFGADFLSVSGDPDSAYAFYAGREGPVYINPYNGELQISQAHEAHETLHLLEEWHRWLAMSDDQLIIGRLITGISNLAFLLLCLTGLYLWFPRRWSWRALRPILWFNSNYKGKARDFNWHNVFGFWNLPVLVVLVATAVVISFGWAHNLVFTLAGEEPSEFRDFRMTLVPPVEVQAPSPGAARVSIDSIFATIEEAYPEYKSIGLDFSELEKTDPLSPVNASVTLDDPMPNRAYVPLELDPYSGEILRALRLKDRSAGLQARLWIRFLHTGAAFGLIGKIVATVATAGSLFLVYTGFALSYRRFFGKRRRRSAARNA